MATPQHRSREEWLEVLRGMTEGHLFGQPEKTYDSAAAVVKYYFEIGLVHDCAFIVDIGSGNGRLAIPLAERDVRYLGLEPKQACVDFCCRAFEPWPHIQFKYLDLWNPHYNPSGKIDPNKVSFPVADNSVDAVILHSVFTHLGRLETCERYLLETRRMLKPGGKCLCSWFRSPPHKLSDAAARTVFRESDIIELIKPFKAIYTRGGYSGPNDQWDTLLEKPAG